MALDMLAQAYEQEDSQTMTVAMFNRDDNSDGSGNEDTVIEDNVYEETIIQNQDYHDQYIDRLIKPRYSESMTVQTHANPYQQFTPKESATSPVGKIGNILFEQLEQQESQESHDSAVMVLEHFQDQIAEVEKENEEIKSKLKRQKTQNDTLLKQKTQLEHQVKKLALKGKENEILKFANQDLETEIEQLKQHENEIENSTKTIKNELNLKTETLAQKNNKIKQLNMELNALRNKSQQNNNIYNELMNKNNEIEMLKGKIMELMQGNGNDNSEEIDTLNNRLYQQNIIIQSMYKQIEDYERINEWLRYQMKWDTYIAVSNNTITIDALEQWKNSLVVTQKRYSQNGNEQQIGIQSGYDDEKDRGSDEVKYGKDGKDNGMEKEKYNGKGKKNKKKKKVKRKVNNKMHGKAESEANDDNESSCYYAWFFK